MLLRVLLVASIAINLSFVAKAVYYDGLVVLGDYKKLPVLINYKENNVITE